MVSCSCVVVLAFIVLCYHTKHAYHIIIFKFNMLTKRLNRYVHKLLPS